MVLTSAVPLTERLKLPCCGEENCGVTCTLVASGRMNMAVK